MNCPKCGYSQEERSDCRKCGVVFSKYYALHATNKTVAVEETDPVQAMSETADGLAEIADLRQGLRELSRRFNEVEFERAERTQLRGELRSLDLKLNADFTQMHEQLRALEERTASTPVPPPSASPEDLQQLRSEILGEHLIPICGRLEQVDARLEQLAKNLAPGTDQRVTESLKEFERRLTQLEGGIARIAEASCSLGDSLPRGLEKVTKDIDELRVSLQNVTIRYSEIGELKKNHLILLDKVESFQSQLEQANGSPEQVASNRVPEIETEVQALRAEVRQALKRLEELEVSPPTDLGGGVAELEQSKKMYSEQGERMQEAVEAKLEKELTPLFDIPNQLTGMDQRQRSLEKAFQEFREGAMEASKRIAEIDKTTSALRAEQEKILSELRWSEEKIAAILARPPEERPPLEDDVHVIRETLDELRRFLNSTTGKP